MCLQARPLQEISTCNEGLGRYCDHAEHNEDTDRAWVLEGAAKLRDLAVELAVELGIDLRDAWAHRLEQIESKPVSALFGGFDGAKEASQALTWLDVQRVQGHHDFQFHRDVAHMSKRDQLSHFAFHCMKLGGLPAKAARGDQVTDVAIRLWLADVLIFGVKLATVMGVLLPAEPIPGFAEHGGEDTHALPA
jgi:hypothetical protein